SSTARLYGPFKIGPRKHCNSTARPARQHCASFTERWWDSSDCSCWPLRFCARSRKRNKATKKWSAHLHFFGALVGFVGLLLLATPFLREITKKKQSHEEVEMGTSMPWIRMLFEIAVASIVVVVLLR